MARIRTIKPEFWTSEQVADCSPTARLLFIGLWNFSDDGGRHPASAKRAKMEIFPGDDFTLFEIETLLNELLSAGLIVSYTVESQRFWQITGWHHQKIDKPTYKHPEPQEFDDHSANDSRLLDEPSPPDCIGLESKGRESNKSPPFSSPKGEDTNGYTFVFNLAWKNYPKRQGSNPKRRAFHAWSARVRASPDEPQAMAEGVMRYARYCHATGKTGTEFVMQAATFFGPDEHYRENWDVNHEASKQNGGRLSAVDAVKQRNREREAERRRAESNSGGTVIDGEWHRT